jgi:hypothetical protein
MQVVQTQMYVALQIAAALSSMRTVLAFTAAKLSRILKIESPLSWVQFQILQNYCQQVTK